MQKPMNPSEEKTHMRQISIPLFSPAIAPEGSAAAFASLWFVICARTLGRNRNRAPRFRTEISVITGI